jgi:hypothetical protein
MGWLGLALLVGGAAVALQSPIIFIVATGIALYILDI